ncbi:peptidase M16 [Bacillus sp. VT-16-64]|nr:peptidase M16 [Bacillus sp. VT-16-64]
MALLQEETVKINGYTLHLIKTDKFKTNTFIWKMKAPLEQDTVTLRALLPQVLQSGTKNHPTTASLRSYLDDLYGATLQVDLAKKGEYHIITFTIEIANEAYLQGSEPLLQKAVDLLKEVLLHPNATNNAFDSETVEKEKRNLKQRITSVYDDKMRYASVRLTEEMCKGERYALFVHGEAERIDEITPESLYQYYEKALAEDELDLYIIGDIDREEAETYCEQISFTDRAPKTIDAEGGQPDRDLKTIVERLDVKQGKLNIGYRTNIRYGHRDYFHLQMFNGIFGGFPHSKLFINVREKAHLAYYAASRIESHKGLLMVMAGIDDKNYEQATTIIHEQMTSMKSGNFTEQEMEQTKAVIKNQFLEAIDTSRGLVEVLYHNVIARANIKPEDWIHEVANTTKDDVVAAAKKVQLDTIYFLTGGKGEK